MKLLKFNFLLGFFAFFFLKPYFSYCSDYILGPGDVVEVNVWGQTDLTRIVTVRPDGKISLPLIDEISVQGLTPFQLDKEITRRLSSFIQAPNVAIIVREFRSKIVFVVGEVKKPGPYILKQDTNVVEALSMAGGLTESADLKGATLIRNGKALSIDLYKILKEKDLNMNIPLFPNDILFVPTNKEKKIYILGEVVKPGSYQYTERLTLMDAIGLAGGLKTSASSKGITITRQGSSTNTFRVNLENILQNKDHSEVTLKPGDIIYVPKTFLAGINSTINQILPSLQLLYIILRASEIIRGN